MPLLATLAADKSPQLHLAALEIVEHKLNSSTEYKAGLVMAANYEVSETTSANLLDEDEKHRNEN